MAALHLAYATAAFVVRDRAAASPLAVLAVALSVFFVAAAFAPRRPWGWTLALVAIALGLPSCAIFAAVPLALKWQSPVLKAAFRRL